MHVKDAVDNEFTTRESNVLYVSSPSLNYFALANRNSASLVVRSLGSVCPRVRVSSSPLRRSATAVGLMLSLATRWGLGQEEGHMSYMWMRNEWCSYLETPE